MNPVGSVSVVWSCREDHHVPIVVQDEAWNLASLWPRPAAVRVEDAMSDNRYYVNYPTCGFGQADWVCLQKFFGISTTLSFASSVASFPFLCAANPSR